VGLCLSGLVLIGVEEGFWTNFTYFGVEGGRKGGMCGEFYCCVFF
jgi:hypothetical protein